MAPKVKICGLTEPARVEQAGRLGAAFLGFVFYPPSPRMSIRRRRASSWRRARRGRTGRADRRRLRRRDRDHAGRRRRSTSFSCTATRRPSGSPQIGLRFGCRVIKALRVETPADLAQLPAYRRGCRHGPVRRQAAPGCGACPGGHGLPFDWRLLEGCRWSVPGCSPAASHADNLPQPRSDQAPIVDVSSGVESRPGIKDPDKLAAFFAAVGRADEVSSR